MQIKGNFIVCKNTDQTFTSNFLHELLISFLKSLFFASIVVALIILSSLPLIVTYPNFKGDLS